MDLQTAIKQLTTKTLADTCAIRVIKENDWPGMRRSTAIGVYAFLKHEWAKGKPDPFVVRIRKLAEDLQISPALGHAYLHRLCDIGLITLEKNNFCGRGMRCCLIPQNPFGGME